MINVLKRVQKMSEFFFISSNEKMKINRKINFAHISEHCASFVTEKLNLATSGEREGGWGSAYRSLGNAEIVYILHKHMF